MRRYIFVILVLLFPSYGYSCDCMSFESVEDFTSRLESAHAAFVGEVVNVTEIENGSKQIAEFNVNKSWKGVDGDNIKVTSSLFGCGEHFYVSDARYLVFAYDYKKDGKLTTNMCSVTQSWSADAMNALNGMF